MPALVISPTPDTSPSHSLHTTTYPLFQTHDLAHLSSGYVASLVSVLNNPEPHCYAQAKQHPEWVMAMEQELNALHKNDTWILTTLPPGKKGLSSK